MPQTISLVNATPRPIAVVRVTTALSLWPRQFRGALDQVYAAVKAGRIRQTGHNVMVYRPRGDGRVDIECGIDTAGPFEPVGEITFSQTPTGPAVTTAHIGPYEQLRLSHQAIVGWSREQGHKLSGVVWEIYGDWEEDPAMLRTDLFHLVQA